ncbi:MAG: DUF2846 domain-containing protein [Pseudomonadales bacterium]|nr:DUF2846 domain-containing protein [Pseudomonadales bacterium]
MEKIMRSIYILTAFIFLSGCALNQKTYMEYKQTEPLLKDSHSRIFIYRIWEYTGAIVTYPIEIDGKEKINLPNGSFTVLDLEPGEHRFKSKSILETVYAEIVMTLEENKVYYLRLGNTEGWVFSQAPAGVLGAINPAMTSVMIEHNAKVSAKMGGPFTLTITEEDQAVKAIEELGFMPNKLWKNDDITN